MTSPPHVWIKWPDKCWATVIRQGYEEACDKPAVAVAINSEEGYFSDRTYPVCKNHARGREMLPLEDIIKITKETR